MRGGPCLFCDPFLVLGAEKHDAGPEYPSFHGWIDELRLSTSLRYAASFEPLSRPFQVDPSTAALYHFDGGTGDDIIDAVGISHGVRRLGGEPPGPVWSAGDTLSIRQRRRSLMIAAAPCPQENRPQENCPQNNCP